MQGTKLFPRTISKAVCVNKLHKLASAYYRKTHSAERMLNCPNLLCLPSNLTADLSMSIAWAEMTDVPGAGVPKVSWPESLFCSGNLGSPFVSFFSGMGLLNAH